MVDLRSIEHLFHALEVLGQVIPSFFLTVICTTLSAALITQPHKTIKFLCMEFVLLVVPIVLFNTVLNKYPGTINIILLVVMVITIFLFQNQINQKPHREAGDYKTKTSDKPSTKILNFVTNSRSIINLIAVVAILAVDFTIFPTRFHKTARYGVSLMDVGVGLYMYGNGIVACEIRGVQHSIRKTFVNVLPILVIGVLRFVTTYLTHYHVNPHEYGVHWNFFITLAVAKLLSAVLMTLITPSFKTCLGIGVAVIAMHQTQLSLGIEEWVWSDVGRDNLITANREGIISTFGYVGIYFLSVAVGFIFHKIKQKMIVFWILLTLNIAIALSAIILHELFNISRCLANSTYILWILFIGCLMSFLLFCYECFLNVIYTNHDAVVYCPQLFEGINYNGLTYFLVANLLTGGINLSMKTSSVSAELALVIILLYMWINSVIVAFLFSKKIKLKL